MNIKELSIIELKGLCYDQLIVLENAQANIKAINQEIMSRPVPKAEDKPEVTPA